MAIAKCSHAGCACLMDENTRYCSAHCEEIAHHEIPDDKGCLCGHEGCDPKGVHNATIRQNDSYITEPRH
jgi:hypothetical protein